ncbi:hypothetical protein HPB51_003519 [Rhipicephalus microplus]|uniref:Tick transposon n=1 Tax=Rhipicephalus microplus TaxID=6941 RepID=A0A9J6DYH7_RHIMP|nr:hypothetical protein HPB51_003519 [Rhipicephalus microplus]
MDLEKLVALGEKMGLSGAELRKWVTQKEKEEKERAKEEKAAELEKERLAVERAKAEKKLSWNERGHAKRVCRLIRSELWRQTRLLQDYLRVLCYASDPPWKAEVELRSLRAYTARMVEFWWASYLSSVLHVIRKKAEKRRSESPVLVLGDDVEIPEHVERILKKGPKFSYEPVVPPQELLAFNRRVATRAPQDQYVRCLLEGVDALSRTVHKANCHQRRDPTEQVVKYFRENDLCLLQADKEGGFVVLGSGSYAEKAMKAISKNFVSVKSSTVRVKTKAVNMCKDFELVRLARDISTSKGNALKVFFTAKTHKPGVPLRTIVNEQGSWQHSVSQFLLKELNGLKVVDPFATKSSEDVVRFLQVENCTDFMFSVDVEDLFIPFLMRSCSRLFVPALIRMES